MALPSDNCFEAEDLQMIPPVQMSKGNELCAIGITGWLGCSANNWCPGRAGSQTDLSLKIQDWKTAGAPNEPFHR